MSKLLFVTLITVSSLFSALSHASEQSRVALRERLADFKYHSDLEQKRLEGLRSEDIYKDVIMLCRGNTSALVRVAFSGFTDVMSLSMFDLTVPHRLWSSGGESGALATMLDSESFYEALRDCQLPPDVDALLLASLYFSDFKGKSSGVIVHG